MKLPGYDPAAHDRWLTNHPALNGPDPYTPEDLKDAWDAIELSAPDSWELLDMVDPPYCGDYGFEYGLADGSTIYITGTACNPSDGPDDIYEAILIDTLDRDYDLTPLVRG